ncbi:diacylglycerol kinase eta isoform X3 [Lates japonicus]|uniref:Diacylglycerol kinase eta isoform X3 n=1 Tax=Lates japonicus TaxID=270547 RepID=A0AAD3R5W3_LATJO|nr:diacylglycerol kinase eta isoform X3 [Lates japonicus]
MPGGGRDKPSGAPRAFKRCAYEWCKPGSEAGCEILHLSLISVLFSPERTERSGTMEDVYHYTRSPAWEELEPEKGPASAAGIHAHVVGAVASSGAADESSDSEAEQEGPQKLIRKVSTSGQIRSKICVTLPVARQSVGQGMGAQVTHFSLAQDSCFLSWQFSRREEQSTEAKHRTIYRSLLAYFYKQEEMKTRKGTMDAGGGTK